MVKREAVHLLALLSLVAVSSAYAEERLAVIVSSERVVELSRQDVAQIFLRKRRFWSDGAPIVPVNRNATSAARASFTKQIFAKEIRFLPSYWNRQYYQGVLPPLTLASDEAVRRFVALESNAIGYVHESFVDDSVRVILLLDPTEQGSP